MDYKKVIEAKYDRKSWQNLLHDIFKGKEKFWNPATVQLNSSRIAKSALSLGKISLDDGESIAVYEVNLADKVDVEKNRRGIRDLLVSDWRNQGYAGAFMFCFRQNESILRFSYVSETWGFDKNGDYDKISTDTKRYTYLLGEGRGCRTAIDQFQKLRDGSQTLQDVSAAFSVEALTKQFYKDLFEWYQWAVDPSSNVSFPNNTKIEDDDRDDIETKMIRLITRVMFVWFVKQKDLVPGKIFDPDYLEKVLRDFAPESKTSGNYYNAILQNLFFATLNRAIVDEEGNRREFAKASRKDIKTLYRYPELFSISEDEVIEMFAEVPFLNGGLFECLDKTKTIDGVEQAFNFDGFSRNDKKFADGRYRNRAVIPNTLFFDEEKGLISILNRYNFTIEENTPEEQQVALDPELLGKVFENLLGAYNPETKETARNQSGSFYTPREIVNYMVDESIVAYLGDTPEVRALFANDFVLEKENSARYREIDGKLRHIRVLDLACGSGAFPMGLLNRLVDLLRKINPDEDAYDLKLAIIENCIYGSDIQSIAAQITKLRFFISLICDCDKNPSEKNFGIPTLPNLETNFVAADSLIAKKKQELRCNLFENPEIEQTKTELSRIRHEHFSAKSASSKRRLREKDQLLREKLAKLLSESDLYVPEDAKQLADWNPYDQNAVSAFFDPEWMFGVNDGFDIVIGNPPYIQLQGNGGELAKKYEKCGYQTFAKTGDIYCLFYERGCQLLKQGGHLCYITSNKWMRAGYGEKTRQYFAERMNPKLLIDFAGVKIFESATVDTNILLLEKGKNRHKTTCVVTSKQSKDGIRKLSDFVQQQGAVCDFATSDSWVILSPIEQSIKAKIEAVGTPLKDWDINIYRGVLTGCNEAFIIDTAKRDEILANCKSDDERERTAALIRPILRGRDIKRYGYDWANLWLIATFPSRNYDIEKFPAVKQHLLSFAEDFLRDNGCVWVADNYLAEFCKKKLEQTHQVIEINGKRIVVGKDAQTSRKKTNNKWFETQDSISYWEDFNRPKVMYPNMTKYLPFYHDKQGFFSNDKSFVITGDHTAFLTAFLNSSLFKFCFMNNFPELLGGTRELRKIFFDKIHVIRIDYRTEKQFEMVVEDIQKEYTRSKAIAIDSMIFDLYGLTSKERELIGFVEIA